MHKSEAPEISVIICTYNTKALTIECLDKLKEGIKYFGKPVETIVVENGTDGTGDVIKEKFPWVKLIEPGENTGFAKGNNIGINACSKNSRYILLLNTDALIEPETLQKSIEFMEDSPNSDVLGCKLILGNGIWQPSAGFLPTPFSIVTWIAGLDLLPFFGRFLPQFHPKFKSFFGKNRRVGWIMGAYFFARREVLDKTKGFDLNFFMYLEEVELCKRINDLKMQIWYTPTFSIIHLDKASSGGDWRRPTIMEIRGAIYYLKKYYKNTIWWILPIIKISVSLRKIAFKAVGKDDRSNTYREVLESI